jgi:glyoxylase I family protein
VIRGSLSHLDLTVKDPARSARFYDPVLRRLGYRPAPELAQGAPCWISEDAEGGAFGIVLVAATTGSVDHDRYAPGLHHLAFHADSRADVDAFYAFLLEIEASVLDPPAEYDYTPGYYAVFFADPDGLKLEVVYEPRLRGRTG